MNLHPNRQRACFLPTSPETPSDRLSVLTPPRLIQTHPKLRWHWITLRSRVGSCQSRAPSSWDGVEVSEDELLWNASAMQPRPSSTSEPDDDGRKHSFPKHWHSRSDDWN
eukprot:945890-Rhodomonas_salina.2